MLYWMVGSTYHEVISSYIKKKLNFRINLQFHYDEYFLPFLLMSATDIKNLSTYMRTLV